MQLRQLPIRMNIKRILYDICYANHFGQPLFLVSKVPVFMELSCFLNF